MVLSLDSGETYKLSDFGNRWLSTPKFVAELPTIIDGHSYVFE